MDSALHRTLPSTSTYADAEQYGELLSDFRVLLDLFAGARPTGETLRLLSAGVASMCQTLEPAQVPEELSLFGRIQGLAGSGQFMLPAFTVTDIGDDRLSATTRFGRYFLGGNAAAHGGTIPLLFDDLFGQLLKHQSSQMARTAYLKTDFLAVTPINRDILATVWIEKVEGRKRFFQGTLHDEERLCARCEGLFIDLKEGQA